ASDRLPLRRGVVGDQGRAGAAGARASARRRRAPTRPAVHVASSPPAPARPARLAGRRLRPHRPRGGRAMSVPAPAQEYRPADAVAGFMAAASIFASLIALVYRPFRITPVTIAVSLIAVGMSSRHQRLATFPLV